MRLRTLVLAMVVAAGMLAAPSAAGAGAGAMLNAVAASGIGALPSPLDDPAAFVDPPRETRPGMRWWWTTPYDQEGFVEDVAAVADVGFGLVELGFSDGGWGDEAQRESLATTVAAAREHDVQVDITMGPGWPLTNRGVSAETGLSQKELDYGTRDLAGPSTYQGPVPPVRATDSCTTGCSVLPQAGTLVAVTAGLVVSRGAPVNTAPTQTNADQAAGEASTSTVLDPASLVDLTDLVDEAGNITWQVPAGQWVLFSFYERPASQVVVDHFSAESSQALLEVIESDSLGESAAALPGIGGSFFEDSLELSTVLFWTPSMREEFQARRGYELTAFLPVLFVPGFYKVPVPEEPAAADFDLPDGLGDRVRHDYNSTLDELYLENHIEVFQDWAEGYDMDYRAQVAYAGAVNVIRAARGASQAGSLIDHESRNAGDPQPYGDPVWHFAFDNYREMASGAHQGGSSNTGIELGATNARDYMVTLAEYKAIQDKAWAGGINRPIIHGLVDQPGGSTEWPGASRFGGLIANSWNHRTWPEWPMWRPLADYWARGNLVLRQGQPVIDIAVYRDDFTTWQATYADIGLDVIDDGVSPAVPTDPAHDDDGGHPIDDALGANTPSPFFDTLALEQAGFRLEYVDPAGLGEGAAGDGAVLFPDGPGYRALVIDQRFMPAGATQALRAQAEAGLAIVVVGEPPARGTAAVDPEGEDAALAEAMSAILALPTTVQVATQADVVDALHELGVRPTAEWSGPQPVYSQHRRTATQDYFYFLNAATQTATFTASLDTAGAGHVLDLWSGDISPLPVYRETDGRVEVPLTLQPGETRVVAFEQGGKAFHVTSTTAGDVVIDGGRAMVRDTEGGMHAVHLSDGSQTEIELPVPPEPLEPSAWEVHVEESNPDGPVPIDVSLTALADWRDIPELEDSSGTGTYTTTIEVPTDWVGSDRGAYLDLGRVDSAVQVFLNGERISPAVVANSRFDLGAALDEGENVLEIVIATSLKNRLVALAAEGRSHGGVASLLPGTQPYGVIGPVTLVPYASAVVELPGPVVSRHGGVDRVATAVEIARASVHASDTVVLATASGYADALAGVPLARHLDAPLLLTAPDRLSLTTADELVRRSTVEVLVLGGEAAVGPAVAADLDALGIDWRRIGGANRFETAGLVVDELPSTGRITVVEGANADPDRGWPDALSAGSLGDPILLATTTDLPAATAARLSAEADVRVVGGPAAVSDEVVAAIDDRAGTVTRVAGPNRYATSLAAADAALQDGADPSTVWLATGRNWPDGLTAGAAGPLVLLVDGLDPAGSPEVLEWLEAHAGTVRAVRLAGGAAAISTPVEQALRDLLE